MNVAWWALAVSGLSLIVAASSLIWNIRSFVLTGPLVVLEIGAAGISTSIDDWRHVWPEKYSSRSDTLTELDRYWSKRILLMIDATNKGRLQVQVSHVFVEIHTKKSSKSMMIPYGGDEMPVEVTAGTSHGWQLSVYDALVQVEGIKLMDVISFSAYALLGNGETVRSNKLPLTECIGLLMSLDKSGSSG